MRLARLTAALLVLGAAACTTTPAGDGGSILIDRPTPPFPYNSLICP